LATVGVPADRAGDFLVRLMDGLGDAAQAALAAFLGVPLPKTLPHSNVGGRLRSPLIAAALGSPPARAAARALPAAARVRLSQALRRRVGVEKPRLAPATESELRRRYAADVAAVERLLGRPTGW
jgi:hypothetical protein